MLQIKHHSELIEAWECSPFAATPKTLREALAVARGQIRRSGERTSWQPKVALEILINNSVAGKLIDFSPYGLCIETSTYFARKVQISIELATNLPEVRSQLSQLGLATLLAEIRWGAEIGDKTRHGLRILNLADAQREHLQNTLMSTIENIDSESLK
jgi:hypothetical protein